MLNGTQNSNCLVCYLTRLSNLGQLVIKKRHVNPRNFHKFVLGEVKAIMKEAFQNFVEKIPNFLEDFGTKSSDFKKQINLASEINFYNKK